MINTEEILKKPYHKIIVYDDKTKTYSATIAEFPGCVAQGNSEQETFDNLNKAAASWIRAMCQLNQSIPEPKK